MAPPLGAVRSRVEQAGRPAAAVLEAPAEQAVAARAVLALTALVEVTLAAEVAVRAVAAMDRAADATATRAMTMTWVEPARARTGVAAGAAEPRAVVT